MLENGLLEVNILLRENMSQFRGETIFQRCYYQLFLEERMLVSYVPYYQFGCGILKMVGPKKQDFWPKINIFKENNCILRIRGAPVRQKLGMILENKVVQKLMLEKNGLLN